MSSLQISKDDKVLSLVSNVFPGTTTHSIENEFSNMTLEDKSSIVGTNTIATLLSNPAKRAGSSDIERAEVQQWLTISAKSIDEERLLDLNTYLAQQTFLVGNDWTVADLVYYTRLHATVRDWDVKRQSELCHVVRWFNHVQHLDEVTSFGDRQLAAVDLTQKFDRGVTVALKKGAPKESVPKDATTLNPQQPATTATSVSPLPQKQAKKDKKDKASKELPAAPKEVVLSPALIALKVGHIREAKLHPDADSLYVSTVDLGESEPRTVVSGLVKYVPLDAMQGRRVVCVCNLKPVAMRGVKSGAMVLAASPRLADGEVKDVVELVTPPESSVPGDVLHFEGFEGEPEAQMNPKKKVFEQVQVGFTTTEKLEVIYKDIKAGSDASGRLVTSKGDVCTVQSLVGATIK